ncbi:helix-turn-helix domain-containing protein [Pseudonocardia xishanensis]
MPAELSVPARGTRPRNRRALITAAAVELFARVGFSGVAMSDIARSVNVAPSALYRHFPGKTELFVAAARATLSPFAEHLAAASDTPLDRLVVELGALAATHRTAGVLWQREARLLPAEVRREVRADLRAVARLLAERIRRERPGLDAERADLLAWSALAAMASASFHRLKGPETVLPAVLLRIVHTGFGEPAGAAVEPVATGVAPHSRRERILRAASVLFADRGYPAVTIDDVGEAAGISGPSVYHHFAGKQELLLAALDRGDEWLWMELGTALAAARDESDALHRLLDSYVRLASRRSEMVAVVLGELRDLPAAEVHRARQSQHDYVTEWTELLRAVRPELDAVAARTEVQAALMVVTAGAQTPHLVRRPGFGREVRAVAEAVLLPS